MEARTLSVLRRRVGAVKGAHNSGVDQSRAAVPRLQLYRSLPLPRVISQRHPFVCSSLKIFAAQCWEQRGTRLWYSHWPAWNLGLVAEHLEGFGRECFPYPANLMILGS
jgi:hypothetical protein